MIIRQDDFGVIPTPDSHRRTPSALRLIGITRTPFPASSIDWIIACLATKSAGPRIVSDPPSPPAPLTFQPTAPRADAISMILRWALPTSTGCNEACAAVFAFIAAP